MLGECVWGEGGGGLCLNRMKSVIVSCVILQKVNISRHNIARGWLIPVKQITVQICMPCQRPGMSSCLDSYLAILFILSQSLTTIVFQSEFGLDSLFSVILCHSHLLPQSSNLPVRRNSASEAASQSIRNRLAMPCTYSACLPQLPSVS